MHHLKSISRVKTNASMLVSALGAVVIFSAPALAATSTTPLYSFNFNGATGAVQNKATTSPYSSIGLTLDSEDNGVPTTCPGITTCNWSDSGSGVLFHGYTDSSGNNYDSTAYGLAPPGQDDLNVAATQALGTETQMVYQASTNPACVTGADNTPNISQIGHASTSSTGQIKLQLSNCIPSISGNTQYTYAECRISGGNNNANNTIQPIEIVQKPQYAMQDGHEYDIACNEIPTMVGGNAVATVITLRVQDITTGKTLPIATFTENANNQGVGSIVSTAPVSVGNKWKNQSPNTNQFNGIVNANDYCEGNPAGTTKLNEMYTCLKNELLL